MLIDRLCLPSAALGALLAFYRRAFAAVPCELGFRLGQERIEIGSAADGAANLFAANETGFQHFAIVVVDMAAAYAHLQSVPGWRPISLSGPELLPPASGGATAFKFRDPEGHPLELLQFGAGAVSALWRERFSATPERLFFGIDHSAVTVRDSEASIGFYEALGMTCAHRQTNVGAAQARLDGFATAGEAEVAIASLSPPDGARPGVELLEYRRPATIVRAAPDGSLAATRFVMAGAHGEAARDPDGHRIGYAAADSLA